MGNDSNPPRRILLVEDEAPLRRILTLNLARRGYTVAEADSVESADDALHAAPYPFDAIVLDINLPDQTGWDVLRHLREAHAEHRPAIILATAVRPVQQRLNEFHPDAVLLKPFPIIALVRLLERVLDATGTADPADTRPLAHTQPDL
jgi:DNA-binding response OmpR family regulator